MEKASISIGVRLMQRLQQLCIDFYAPPITMVLFVLVVVKVALAKEVGA